MASKIKMIQHVLKTKENEIREVSTKDIIEMSSATNLIRIQKIYHHIVYIEMGEGIFKIKHKNGDIIDLSNMPIMSIEIRAEDQIYEG